MQVSVITRQQHIRDNVWFSKATGQLAKLGDGLNCSTLSKIPWAKHLIFPPKHMATRWDETAQFPQLGVLGAERAQAHTAHRYNNMWASGQ